MDVRLFKFLVFAVGEILFFALHYLLPKVMPTGHFYAVILQGIRNLMVILPFLLLLPEDNWIWLVEENLRQRKISLRSKASKHLYLSMFYWMLIGLPFFVIVSAYLLEQPDFGAPLSYPFGGGALLMGIYCAWKNADNVRRHDKLFAVGWDRRSAFVEIFIGFRVARNLRFFYHPALLLLFAAFIVASGVVVPFYYERFGVTNIDRQKFLVLATFFNFFLAFSTWTTTMYVVFQIVFLRGVENWAKQLNGKGEY